MMKKIMNAMLLSCVKATELLEMKEDISLGFLKTMQLHVHTAVCSGCRNYKKQSRMIDQLLQKNFYEISSENINQLEETIVSKIE